MSPMPPRRRLPAEAYPYFLTYQRNFALTHGLLLRPVRTMEQRVLTAYTTRQG
jgi:hypothetical protein